MSTYSNNANNIIVQMIQQLQQWNKKPSLNDKISDFLEIFHESVNKEQINFAEAGLFLQESSVLHGKQVDLLYKGFLECHKNLSLVNNDKKIEEQKVTVDPPNLPNEDKIVEKKVRKKHETKKPEEQIEHIEEAPEKASEKFSIPGIPDEILEKLKLSDCLPGGPIDEFIDKLDQNHPLYSIISKLGKEISQNKDIFTFNNLSLSGMSWNALFKIEEVLSRITRRDDEVIEECPQTQTDDDSGVDTDHFCSGVSADSALPSSEDLFESSPDLGEVSQIPGASTDIATAQGEIQAASGEIPAAPGEIPAAPGEIPAAPGEFPAAPGEFPAAPEASTDNLEASKDIPEASDSEVTETPHKKRVKLTEELKRHITKECIQKVVKINLFQLDLKLLQKKYNFCLPAEYFATRRSARLRKRKAVKPEDPIVPKKRKKLEDTSLTFDLELFETFCFNYYESQGVVIRTPEPIQINRKSIDNQSEVSYDNPFTPADSGRFSLSYVTDSEFEHCDGDGDDTGRDSNVPFSRADSGIEVMVDSDLEFETERRPQTETQNVQSDTLKTLQTLFPATFSDPERAEALKDLYKQPEDDANYVQWKKFIDDKTANETEFNIHEYGTDILNSFPSHSTDTLNFENIVQDKSVEDISRYFVSALQLANTYNVEIVDKHPGEIRADAMQLKFLTNTRAHEEIDSHLNDISEDHFVDTLLKSRNYQSTPMHPKPTTSTFVERPIHKRKRLEY